MVRTLRWVTVLTLLCLCAACAKRSQLELAGSGVSIGPLTAQQVDALALTGKVWGFLKYHHPRVTAGREHWDAELLRRLPQVLAAKDRVAVQGLLVAWIDTLGTVRECGRCAALPADAALKPRLAWLDDRALLGEQLGAQLRSIYKNRVPDQQFYVDKDWIVDKPVFDHEPDYRAMKYPDAGLQILAVLRFWNIVEYWFPYRDLIDEDWDDVLRDALARAATAADAQSYQLELAALAARTDDGHANFIKVRRPPMGPCRLPAMLRHVEGEFVVEGVAGEGAVARQLLRGDVLVSLDGRPVPEIVAAASRYYARSNEEGQMGIIGRALTRGACGPVRVGLRRESLIELDSERVPAESLNVDEEWRNDRPGPTLQKLSPQVAYLKLSTAKESDVEDYIRELRAMPALIVDLRNYPDNLAYSLGGLLVEKSAPFMTYTKCDLSNPGAHLWDVPSSLAPDEPHFPGRVIVLVDESTMSRGEYTAMALRAGPRAAIVGRQTAGADGDLSLIPLPGGVTGGVSGNGVFYPDRRPTQQVGVEIDVPCEPTIAGIRAGRDEILECALQTLNGPETR